MLRSLLFLFNLLIAYPVFAQNSWKGHYFEGSMHYGRLLRHTEDILLDYREVKDCKGAEFSWVYHSYGKEDWSALAKFPKIGLAFSFQDFGDNRLGWGLGLMPHFTFSIYKYKKIEFNFRAAMGFAYLSTHWDGIHNPQNNIIGSHFNNNTAFRLGIDYAFHRQFSFRPSISFTHYSNAASQQPNRGINAVTFQCALMYRPQPLDQSDYQYIDHPPAKRKGIVVNISSAIGVKEAVNGYRGPKYPLSCTNLEAGFYLTRANRLKLGLAHEYLVYKTAFLLNNGGVTEEEARQVAHKGLFYIAEEYLMKNVGFLAEIGYYFYNPPQNFPFTRIGVRYYPLDPLKHRVAPYIGIRMKSHMVTAEYFDICLGVALQ